MVEVSDELGQLVERFLSALNAADGAGARGLAAPAAWTRTFERMVEEVARFGTRYTASGERWSVAGRAAFGVEAVGSGARATLRFLAEEREGAWRLVGATDARAEVWAFLVRWIDAGTRFDDLPSSLRGAAWGTALAGRLLAGERPARALDETRVAAADETRRDAVEHLTAACGSVAPGKLQVAVLGARELPATGQVAVGLSILGDDRERPLWLTLAPGRDGGLWTLLGVCGWPSLTALIEGEALERSVASVMSRRAPETSQGDDRIERALEAGERPAAPVPADADVARLLGRMRAAFERPSPGPVRGNIAGLREVVLRLLEERRAESAEPVTIDVDWLRAHGPALVARAMAELASPAEPGVEPER